MQDFSEPRLVNRVGRPIPAEDLRRVEFSDPAPSHAPYDAAHAGIVARGALPELSEIGPFVSPAAGEKEA
jgi:hypothetical protein